ncbi:MAG: hypothetical protein WED34_03805, partial [Planctomycetales bacterium]
MDMNGKPRLTWRLHWRLMLPIPVAVAISGMILHLAYQHTFWFLKLWCAVVLGTPVGMIAGHYWQTRAKERQLPYSMSQRVSFFAVSLLVAGIALFELVPDLRGQEAELARMRGLSVSDISEILLQLETGQDIRVDDPDLIRNFVAHSAVAELFYPSHEGRKQRFRLSIELSDGRVLSYDAGVPERHLDDLSLDFV